MKRSSILAAFALVAFAACNTVETTQTTTDAAATTAAPAGDVAYVRSDVVLTGCDIFQTEGVALREKTEKAQASWAKTEQGFQYEANQLQEKYSKGLITTANAQSQQAAIEKRIRNFQANTQKQAKALEEENYVFTNRTQDLFNRAVKQLNADKNYKMILDASMIIDADTTLDLSQQVLDIINELYATESAETK